ncbi:MAG: helix-turn-helix domain-containing protein [Actinomycetota bacterium]|nr:helix-turn-helix domain-containing protein [Actinomycetota bacterium]
MSEELSGGSHDDLLHQLVRPDFLDGYARLDSSRRDAAARAASARDADGARDVPEVPEVPGRAGGEPPARADGDRTGAAPGGRGRGPRGRRPGADRLPLRRDRRGEIVEQLRQGPASAQELADRFGISREGVLRWLRMLEADGAIESTAEARTSRNNRWVLAEHGDRDG